MTHRQKKIYRLLDEWARIDKFLSSHRGNYKRYPKLIERKRRIGEILSRHR